LLRLFIASCLHNDIETVKEVVKGSVLLRIAKPIKDQEVVK